MTLFLSFILNLLTGNVSVGKHCSFFSVIDLAFLVFVCLFFNEQKCVPWGEDPIVGNWVKVKFKPNYLFG